VQKRILERETVVGADHQEKLGEIEEQKTTATAKLKALQERWDKERELVAKIRELREKLEAGHAANGTVDAAASASAGLKTELQALEGQLSVLQGETGLIRVCVDAQIVGEVLSAWTGIPAGKMLKDEITTVLALQEHLGRRVIGQQDGNGVGAF
jgi:type VI secretion system protein VasG